MHVTWWARIMGDTVFIHGRAVLHAGSAGRAAGAFPDVCLCPPPPPVGPTPTPLANTACATDLQNGSQSVVVQGHSIGLQQSCLARSTGNEMAQSTGGGVLTHAVGGPARFVSYAMDVLIEGQGVIRHLDATTHNHSGGLGNTPPWAYVASAVVASQSNLRGNAPPSCCLTGVRLIDLDTGRGATHGGHTDGVPAFPYAPDLYTRLQGYDGCLEVVAGPGGARIRIDVDHDAACPHKLHPRIQITPLLGSQSAPQSRAHVRMGPSTATDMQVASRAQRNPHGDAVVPMQECIGQSQYDVRLLAAALPLQPVPSLASLLTPFTDVINAVQEYLILVESCVNAVSGAFAQSRMLLRIYAQADLSIAVSIKPWAEQHGLQHGMLQAPAPPNGASNQNVQIRVMRNGQEVQITQAYEQLLTTTRLLLHLFEDVPHFIPCVGWNITVSAGFFEGTLTGEWQWQPLARNDAWDAGMRWALMAPRWHLHADVMLIRVQAKAMVGVQFHFDALLLRFFLGIELLSLQFAIELIVMLRVPMRVQLGSGKQLASAQSTAISAVGTIEACCYGRISLIGLIVEVKAAVESHLTAEGHIVMGLAGVMGSEPSVDPAHAIHGTDFALRVVRERAVAFVSYRWPGTGIKSRRIEKPLWEQKVLWECGTWK